ncbi:hypothetical protein QQS21_002884 [Conoideocrella luteorostrata]|uniref:Domain of unknown function at the cortex 1 domain-containing protein n=1 Tax=Conoideocrella luteorostrata TaxID=1105319 RepID=A0AAJ0FWU8_9HYPO|nr:hypothetical protein QQS21_002884 [Conoideocrella luteorostrata]
MEKYLLRITAGPSYNVTSHVEVPVNRPEPIHIKSEAADIELNVRIQNYTGLPFGSPSTSPYFSTEPHAYNQDQYSISFRFKPQRPATSGDAVSHNTACEDGDSDDKVAKVQGISGHDLQFGNDFDRPIRDKLPPGFNTALRIVRWWIDPGLDGDAYADKPYLYGPALSSFNSVCLGVGEYNKEKGGLWFDEGGDDEGMQARQAVGAPDDAKARMKWALRDDSKTKWVFEYGKTYGLDFFNPYIDFTNLALKLPGFHLPIVKYWDGQGLRRSHELRYVLRNKKTGEVYLVIVFTIYLREDINEDGSIKEGAAERAVEGNKDDYEPEDYYDEVKALEQAKAKFAPGEGNEETSVNDVD